MFCSRWIRRNRTEDFVWKQKLENFWTRELCFIGHPYTSGDLWGSGVGCKLPFMSVQECSALRILVSRYMETPHRTDFKKDRLLAIPEGREDSFSCQFEWGISGLSEPEQVGSMLLWANPLSWREGRRMGECGWSQEDRGNVCLCPHMAARLWHLVKRVVKTSCQLETVQHSYCVVLINKHNLTYWYHRWYSWWNSISVSLNIIKGKIT